MSKVRPFRGLRPRKDIVERVAALPYDVYNREEAKAEVKKEPLSFLRIDRAETQFEDSVDTYDPCVYEKAKELLDSMISDGSFVEEKKAVYYVYELTMNGRSQTGIVACASIDDYENNVIKKHENTRADKEIDRIRHVDTCEAQTGPIFLAYRAQEAIDAVVEKYKQNSAEYDFTSADEIRHRVWVIDADQDVEVLLAEFHKINEIYIADGHHRAASAVKVGKKRREENPGYTGEEEFNFFLSVLFPHNQLLIMDYNRLVKDLSGVSKESFLLNLSEKFLIEASSVPYKPESKGRLGMYIEKQWYKLTVKPSICNEDPVEGLDVSILQNEVLAPLLNIQDPKTDNRIDFVGGIRGLKELERRCESDMTVAFSMYPTSIEELFDVADANRLMPPKSTWFEPKLRSGIFIHKI